MPPSLASVIAILDSVTVSMAADNIGVLSFIDFVRCEDMSTSTGSTSEYAGTNKTSSNASDSSEKTLELD